MDSLCSSLSLLNASASALLTSNGDPDSTQDAVREQHYNALKAYVFFLHWIATQAEQQAKESSKSAPAAGATGKSRTKARKAAQLDSVWDWDANREKLAGLSQIDFWQLCNPNNPEEAFLMLWTQTVSCSLESMITTATRHSTYVCQVVVVQHEH